ncbi:MAG: hypothetical protein P0S95_08035 [Rhabdochlamydiaceae bacterium]|nr:hypothetical protein [Candidatus Amphrikana amoebophyrae]
MKWKLFSSLASWVKNHRVFSSVIFAHIFVVVASIPMVKSVKTKSPSLPMVVTHVKLKPKKIIPKKATVTKSKAKPLPTKTKKPQQQKSIKNKEVDQIFANLNKLQKKQPKQSSYSSQETPTTVTLSCSNIAVNYKEELSETLKSLIELPKKGSIKLSFVIDEMGRLSKICILSSSEEENSLYVTHRLNGYKLPKAALPLNNKEQITLTLFAD